MADVGRGGHIRELKIAILTGCRLIDMLIALDMNVDIGNEHGCDCGGGLWEGGLEPKTE